MYFPRFNLLAGGLGWSLPAVVSWASLVVEAMLLLSVCSSGVLKSRSVVATTTLLLTPSGRAGSGDAVEMDISTSPDGRRELIDNGPRQG